MFLSLALFFLSHATAAFGERRIATGKDRLRLQCRSRFTSVGAGDEQRTSHQRQKQSTFHKQGSLQRLFFLTLTSISFFSVGRSTSDKRLICRQLPDTLCFPSFARSSFLFGSLALTYKVRLCLRGEKATAGQSASRPPAYVIVVVPKPTMLVPHITPFCFVASSISFAMIVKSSRVCLSGSLLMKSLTVCLVGFVFASAIVLECAGLTALFV